MEKTEPKAKRFTINTDTAKALALRTRTGIRAGDDNNGTGGGPPRPGNPTKTLPTF